MGRLVAGFILSFVLAWPVAAQDDRSLQSPILVLEVDQLYIQSDYGQRVARELEATGAEIAAENRRIEAELTEEERALTERRPSLSTEEFRALAEAFDEKVQNFRQTQDAKARALGSRSDEARRTFLNAAQPALTEIMRETGAAVIIERRNVIISADVIDITDLAIDRVNAVVGDGSTAPENTEN